VYDSDFFWKHAVQNAVFSDLVAPDRDSAVRAMVRILMAGKGFTRNDLESIVRLMLGREELGSTGIGGGVAVPHTRVPFPDGFHVGWFVAEPPIDFEAHDGEPVFLFFCLVSPHNKPGVHLRLLEDFSKLLKDDRFVSTAHFGIDEVREFLGVLESGSHGAQAVEAELAGIGVGLNDLAAEKARFKWRVAESGWASCQAEISRVEAVLEQLQSRLAEVGAAAAKEGANRLAVCRGSLPECAARAKRGHLFNSIRQATSDGLSSVDVQVNGPQISIRAEAKTKGHGERLRCRIALLDELSGYHTDIFIQDGVINLDPLTATPEQSSGPSSSARKPRGALDPLTATPEQGAGPYGIPDVDTACAMQRQTKTTGLLNRLARVFRRTS
jgi:mannitol/fructose-specific phosphotransferase system IIA component (Ntr-type)